MSERPLPESPVEGEIVDVVPAGVVRVHATRSGRHKLGAGDWLLMFAAATALVLATGVGWAYYNTPQVETVANTSEKLARAVGDASDEPTQVITYGPAAPAGTAASGSTPASKPGTPTTPPAATASAEPATGYKIALATAVSDGDNQYQPSHGMYLLVRLSIRNVDSDPVKVDPLALRVTTADGTVYRPWNEQAAEWQAHAAEVGDTGYRSFPADTLDPGETATGYVAFDVPEGAVLTATYDDGSETGRSWTIQA